MILRLSASDYLYCPDCEKKGVTRRFYSEDQWCCRYCGWGVYTSGYDTIDVVGRERLRKVNPGKNV